MKKLILLALSIFLAGSVFAESLIITHVDGRFVLLEQKVKTYGLILDSSGNPVTNVKKDDFTVYEVWEGGEAGPLEITSIQNGVNETERLYMTLLIDNSGSMYWNSDGSLKNSEDSSVWRITAAIKAVNKFISLNNNKLHKISIISFNSKLNELSDFTNDKDDLKAALNEITVPDKGDRNTELYEALYKAGLNMTGVPGRRIVLILSDGENVNDPDEDFSVRHTPKDIIELYQQEGITCFTIGLSRGADEESLEKFSTSTGGIFTIEHNADRLESLYNAIHEQLKNEFALTYKTPLKASDETQVIIKYKDTETERTYFSALLFGAPWPKFSYLYLLITLGAVIFPVLLVLSWKRKKKVKPSLQVLSGKKKTIILKDGATQSLTAGGIQSKITAKGGQYTIISQNSTVVVNNKKTKSKILKSGDLIDVGGTQILFNAPEDE